MLPSRPKFPGMDPWLESSVMWPDFHNSLVLALRDALTPLVEPSYFVSIEERLYFWREEDIALVGEPDVTVGLERPRSPRVSPPQSGLRPDSGVVILDVDPPVVDPLTETYLKVRDLQSGVVVTVIEVLSPSNKFHPEGRRKYLKKRDQVLKSRTSLIEIDLLRGGQPMLARAAASTRDYRILVSRGRLGHRGKLYLFQWPTPIPDLPVPLRRGEREPVLPANDLVQGVLDRGRYFRRLGYQKPPSPALRPEDNAWAAAIIAEASRPAD